MERHLARLSLFVRKAVRRMGHDISLLSGVRYEMSFLVEILARQRVTVVFDIGANVGQWAAELRRAGYEGRIVSFEPVSNAHRLLSNAAQHDSRWIVAPPMAIADRDGVAEIQVASNSPMSSLLPIMDRTRDTIPGSTTVGSESVRVAKLSSVIDDYITPDDIVFLKLDVQGSERAILDGAGARLARLEGIQLEMSFTPLYEDEVSAFQLYSMLEHGGFRPVLFIPGYYSSSLAQQLQVDGVFVRAKVQAAS